MRSRKLRFSKVILSSCILMSMLLLFVSILGENNKIDKIVKSYLNELKNQNYSAACSKLASNVLDSNSLSTCYNRGFLIELSLLTKFDLLEEYDYKIEVERNGFWIPFLSSKEISVNISLAKIDDESVQQFIKDLFVVSRDNGVWNVGEIRLEVIHELYSKLEKEIDFNKFIEKTKNGYKLNEVEIDFSVTSELEKRLLRFNLLKISEALSRSTE